LWAGLLATNLWLCGTAAAQDFTAATDARQAALAAGAPELAADLFADAEKTLAKARKDANRGNTDRSEDRASRARDEFLAAELEALQTDLLSEARATYRRADMARARRYAPRTMERSAALITAAADALDRDRSDRKGASALAAEGTASARLALEITTIARDKPNVEDLLLQHKKDIERLQSAVGIQEDVSQDLASSVMLLEQEVTRLRTAEQQLTAELEDNRAFSASLEEEIRALDDELGGATAERRQLVRQIEAQARASEQLEQVQALFVATEAQVFEQSGQILIRLLGLNFASGSAEIIAASEPLMSKINRALDVYPASDVIVEGHTDSKGSDRLNQRLSQNRAETVLNRIVRDTGMAPDRLTAVGYGESRPIANNETEEGRAQNRRIDLVIQPATG